MSDNNKVISVADRSVKAVGVATAALAKVVADLQSLSADAVALSDDIQQKESQIAALDNAFVQATRTKNAELALQVLENEKEVFNSLRNKFDLAYISTADLKQLNTDLNIARSERTEEISRAVSAAVRDANAAANAKLAETVNAHKVEIATLQANSTSAAERIQFLTNELNSARAQIEAERDTRLKIAQAEAGRQGVVINSGGK